MSLSPAMRLVRAIQLEGALADAQRAAEESVAPHIPKLPAGMKWLATPREALTARQGDARTVEIAFARWLFWRILLMWRRPTLASTERMAHKLRGATLWKLAVNLHQEGKPLPLKAGVSPSSVPAWAVSPQYAPHNPHAPRSPRRTTRDSGDEDDPWDYWDSFGDISGIDTEDYFDSNKLLTDREWEEAGGFLTFEDILTTLHEGGYTDLDIADILDGAWNGQASLWAGQDLYDNAGIAATFDITDPNFYLYLRNQAGYLISGIDETTRSNIASSLWGLLGGGDYFAQGVPVDRVGQALATWFRDELGPSADYRAYMIAVTETARAESYGTFLSLWTTGARQKIWIANAGACIYCVANVEEGAIPLTSTFPGGFQSPPQHPMCFVAGTPVQTITDEVAIEDIQIGDRVWTHMGRGERVTALMRREYSGDMVALTANGRTVEATPNHPVRVQRDGYTEWIAVGELTPDDRVLVYHGGLLRDVPQQTMRHHVRNILVYNFEVAYDQSYIAGGVCCHNCRCAISAAISDSFDVNDWVSRNPDTLDPLLFQWGGAAWPNTDLSDVELPDIDLSDFERASRADAPATAHATRERYALGVRLSAEVEALTTQWLRDAHVRKPTSEADIRVLAKRLRDRDELPDAREADEMYLHRLKGAVRDVLTTAGTAEKVGSR